MRMNVEFKVITSDNVRHVGTTLRCALRPHGVTAVSLTLGL